MRVVVLGADDGVFSPVCQLTVLHDNLRPPPLVREDVAAAPRDIAPIFQPAEGHVPGAHLALQQGRASLLHTGALQVAGELDGNPWIQAEAGGESLQSFIWPFFFFSRHASSGESFLGINTCKLTLNTSYTAGNMIKE